MKYRILKILLAVWVALWIVFIAKELFVKGALGEYRNLLARPLEGKHSYITGEVLYSFLDICMRAVPEKAAYKLVGLEKGSLEQRRAAYYLYPRIESDHPEFILLYKTPNASYPDYEVVARMNATSCVLKKVK